MGNKFKTLLQINTMMKQNAEARLAELSEQRLKLGSLIRYVKQDIENQAANLSKKESIDGYHSDYLNYEKWKASQLGKIDSYQDQDRGLIEAQKNIKRDLAELIVKETYFKKSLKFDLDQKKLTESQLESERTQNIWLQTKR